MVHFLDESGKFYKRKRISYKEFRVMSSTLGSEELKKLGAFLNKGAYAEFSVGTRYKNPWPDELMILYEKFGETLAAEFLGV